MYKTILKWILPILICLSSFYMVAQKTSTPEFHEQSIQYLDEKRNTVMTLAVSSAAISTSITILPGDTGTPVANDLADLSSKFLLVLGAIYLEKYALTLTCMVTFKYIIPILCEYIKIDRDKSTFKSHRDFDSEIEMTFKHF